MRNLIVYNAVLRKQNGDNGDAPQLTQVECAPSIVRGGFLFFMRGLGQFPHPRVILFFRCNGFCARVFRDVTYNFAIYNASLRNRIGRNRITAICLLT